MTQSSPSEPTEIPHVTDRPSSASTSASVVSDRVLGHALAIAEALFSGHVGAPPPTQRMRWLGNELRDFLTRAGTRARLLIRLALWATTWVLPLLRWRLPPLRRQPVAERMKILSSVEGTTLGVAFLALKVVLCALYFEHPEAAREIGYNPERVEQP